VDRRIRRPAHPRGSRLHRPLFRLSAAASGAHYPRVYITTNTRDDRVHPGHARKFAARLGDMGYDRLYYEETSGGHSNDADPVANARRWARHYTYLASS
jgi:prolyl oligopeptidase PreP (S9A serine peptidase family)